MIGRNVRARLATIDAGDGLGATFGYDAGNRRSGAVLGNGVTTVPGFDLLDRLTSLAHAKDAAALLNVNYGYDPAGDRLVPADLPGPRGLITSRICREVRLDRSVFSFLATDATLTCVFNVARWLRAF